ncbi:MAG: hypothetical protein V7L09_29225 [Nostoc sp.]|uniref:hypothetical protein n=1 Tax=Nostoc sp. TaxID=1180 RepID=UPI002FEE69BB
MTNRAIVSKSTTVGDRCLRVLDCRRTRRHRLSVSLGYKVMLKLCESEVRFPKCECY